MLDFYTKRSNIIFVSYIVIKKVIKKSVKQSGERLVNAYFLYPKFMRLYKKVNEILLLFYLLIKTVWR